MLQVSPECNEPSRILGDTFLERNHNGNDKSNSNFVDKNLYVLLERENLVSGSDDHNDMTKLVESYLDSVCLVCRGILIAKKRNKTKKPFKRKVNIAKRTTRDLKNFSSHVRKIKIHDQLNAVVNIMQEKERLVMIHLIKTGHPTFRIVSKLNQKGL